MRSNSEESVTANVTPLGISVLALLVERPMHPYEMYRLLLERHEDRRVKIRPGSLYHTVDRMAESGLVEATGTERDGGRPERTTYRITDAESTALLQAAADRQVEEAYLLAAHYLQEQLTTELNWLTDLIGRLERKELRWPYEDML